MVVHDNRWRANALRTPSAAPATAGLHRKSTDTVNNLRAFGLSMPQSTVLDNEIKRSGTR